MKVVKSVLDGHCFKNPAIPINPVFNVAGAEVNEYRFARHVGVIVLPLQPVTASVP